MADSLLVELAAVASLAEDLVPAHTLDEDLIENRLMPKVKEARLALQAANRLADRAREESVWTGDLDDPVLGSEP